MKHKICSILMSIVLTTAAFGTVVFSETAPDDIAACIMGDCIIDHMIEVQSSETDGVTYKWYMSQEENGTYEEIKNNNGKTLKIMPWYAGAWIKAKVSKGGAEFFTEPVKELSGKTVLKTGLEADAVGSKTVSVDNSISDGYVSVELDYKKDPGSSQGCGFIFIDPADVWGSKITFWDAGLLAETDGGKTITTGTDDGKWHTLNFTIDFTTDEKAMKVYIDNGAVVAWEDSRYGASELNRLTIDLTGIGFEYKNLSISHILKQSTPPEAQNVNITGELLPNAMLTTEYDYVDSDNDGGGEGDSEIRWFVSESRDGTYSLIGNQNGREFVPTDLFIGKFIRCSVRPADKNLSVGSEVFSDSVQISSDKNFILDERFENGNIHNKTLIGISDKTALRNDTLVLNNGGKLYAKPGLIVQQRYVIDFNMKKQAGFCTVDVGNGKQLKLDYDNGAIEYDGESVEYTFKKSSADNLACEINWIENTITFTVNYEQFITGSLDSDDRENEFAVSNSGAEAVVDHFVIYTAPNVGNVPQASNVAIIGALNVDSIVTVSYDYFDADGDEDKFSVIKWYISENNTNFELLQNSCSLKITEDMAGKYIKASVVPIDARTMVGSETFSGSVCVSTEIVDVFDEDFDDFAIGNNGWRIESGKGTILKKDNNLNYENTSGESFLVAKTFDIGDADSVRYDVTLKYPNKVDNGVLYYNLSSSEGIMVAIMFSGDDLSLYLRNSENAAGMETYSLGKIDFDKVYKFSFQVNLLSQTFDFYLDGQLVKSDCYFAQGYNKTFRAPNMVYIDSASLGTALNIDHHMMKKMTSSESHTTLNYNDILYYANGEGVNDTYVSKKDDEVYSKVKIENFEGIDKTVVVTLASYLDGTLTKAESKTYSIENNTNYRYYESPEIRSNGNETFKCYVWRTDINHLKLVNTKHTFAEETATKYWDLNVEQDIDSNSFKITGKCDYSADVIAGIMVKTDGGEIICLNTAPLDNNGEFSFRFKPSDEVRGNINIRIGLMNMSQTSNDNCSLYYDDTAMSLHKSDIDDILNKINTSQNESELEKVIDNNVETKILLRGVLKQSYERCKAEAIRYLYTDIQKEKYRSLGQVNRDLSAIVAAISIQNAEDKCSEIEKFIDLLNLEKDLGYSAIKNSIDVMYMKLTEDNMPAEYETFADAIRKAQAISLINYNGADKMETLFVRYNDVLGLDVTGDYSKVNKLDVGKLMVGKSFEDIREIREAFSNAVSKIKAAESSNSPSQSASSSGSSSKVANIAYESSGVVDNPKDNSKLPDQRFKDVDINRYSYKAIENLAAMSIINGYEDGCFYPDNTITREEFSKMIVLAMKYTKGNKKISFHDVKSNEWYYDYIEILYSNDIIQGIGNECFGVGYEITREDMAVIIYRCLMKDRGTIEEQRAEKNFSDDSEISGYAKRAIDALYRGNIINGMGDNMFAPKESTTREQAAVILCNIISNM